MLKLSASYKDGTISMTADLHEVLQSLDVTEKLDLIESLSCDDQVIKHVADQIIDKYTESVYAGASLTIAGTDGAGTPLDIAWRRVAKASGAVAKREIERLENALRLEKESHQKTHDLHQRQGLY